MPSQKPEHHPQSEPVNQQPAPPRTRRCRHVFIAGHQCGSPCLREEQFCYYHHATRRPLADPRLRRARTTTYDLPTPEDRDSIRAAIAQVMHDIANNHIDLRRAGLILYSLQIALGALPKEPQMSGIQAQSISAAARPTTRRAHRKLSPVNNIPAKPPIEEIVLDDTYGLIAPEAFLEPEVDEEEDPGDEVLEDGRLVRNTLAYKLLKEVELYEARQEGYEKARADLLKEGELHAPQPKIGIDINAAAEVSTATEAEVLVNKAAPVPGSPTILCLGASEDATTPHPNSSKDAATAHLGAGKDAGAPHLGAGKDVGAPHLDSEMWVPPSPEALPIAVVSTLRACAKTEIRRRSYRSLSRLRAPLHRLRKNLLNAAFVFASR